MNGRDPGTQGTVTMSSELLTTTPEFNISQTTTHHVYTTYPVIYFTLFLIKSMLTHIPEIHKCENSECVLSLQLCPTLCDPMDCSPLGSSVYGILQARVLEWFAIPFSRRSSQPKDHSRIEPGSPALQAYSLPFDPPGKTQKSCA